MGLGFLQINNKIMVFGGIIKHIFVHRELQFGKTSWHLQGRKLFYPEGGGSIFFEMLITSCHMT